MMDPKEAAAMLVMAGVVEATFTSDPNTGDTTLTGKLVDGSDVNVTLTGDEVAKLADAEMSEDAASPDKPADAAPTGA